jgi:hypothetical protein
MAKLNQVIAIEKGTKSRTFQELTEAHQALQKPALLSGISRTYRPKDEEGEQLPPESTRVQEKAEDVIRTTVASLTKLFDVTATKDWTNCKARADVVVDGQTLLSQVPATYLLFLEKQLVDLHTFVRKLPVLDASEAWSFDPSADCWATEPVQTTRTKKIPRNHVKTFYVKRWERESADCSEFSGLLVALAPPGHDLAPVSCLPALAATTPLGSCGP